MGGHAEISVITNSIHYKPRKEQQKRKVKVTGERTQKNKGKKGRGVVFLNYKTEFSAMVIYSKVTVM